MRCPVVLRTNMNSYCDLNDNEGNITNLNILKALAHFSLKTTFNLTAPVCSSLVNNQRSNWIQLSGHPGSLAPAGPGTIWKKQPKDDSTEISAYQSLMSDIGKHIVPTFYKELYYEGERFIEIKDLLVDFKNPSIIDIKMGTRTFLESEVSNTKARNDLYKKMLNLDPTVLTPEENEEEALTKLRYMDLRDTLSSSRNLGFRIEALKLSSSQNVTETKKVKTRGQALETLSLFIQKRHSTRKQILERLKDIRKAFESSPFFMSHEIIGSSILMVYDENHAGVWLIDFAKTHPLPNGVVTDHRSTWKFGNHEEGYLTGLNNLIKIVEDIPVKKKKKLSFISM